MKPLSERRLMVEKCLDINMRRQCELVGIHRSGLYYRPVSESEENLRIMRLMDEQYLKMPFYGLPRLSQWLMSQDISISKSRTRRLMKLMGWQTIFRKPNTSKPNKWHKVYPYLLKGLRIERPNQVWAIYITYVPMRHGYMYLFAIIDHCTRYVANWSLSNNERILVL
jgi:putative transposase